MIFFFDWSMQSLVYPAPPDGHRVAIHVNALRAIGWTFDEAEARRVLPRYDRSQLTPGVPSKTADEIRRVLRGL